MLEFRHVLKECAIALKDLKIRTDNTSACGPMAIAMIDGTQYHGGMNDRFKGIVTLYAWCRQRGIPFRILYNYPFELENYLEPASYDWRLRPGEFNDSIMSSRIFYARGEEPGKRLASLKRISGQLHYYGNRDCLDLLNATGGTGYTWGGLFRELFRPVPVLAGRLEELKKMIGGPYNASVFRFQNMLGDFREYKFRPVGDASERKRLLKRCLAGLETQIRFSDGRPMLVTSDSRTFLEEAASIDGVFTIPGTVVHIGGMGSELPENPFETFMKSFLDFYMISEASHVACVGTKDMYPSEFPQYAAKVNGRPFCRVIL